jgi:bifunctional non-homologous end joining protein LigD
MRVGRSIDDYRKKRDFARTPEPLPGEATGGDVPSFVVHRHEARNLHYDLRLRMEGVLRSWAVPRGFAYDPAEKRLAVRTEDHPLEYETFEGVIPKGEYGAGTMRIWDRGSYAVLGGDPVAAVAAGELKFVLHGRKLRGEWHMVRTKGAGEQWLLFKARDRYAAGDGVRGVDVDLGAAAAGPAPKRFAPMRAGTESAPFSDPGFVFELEFRGRRVWAAAEGGEVRWLGLRRGERRQALAALDAELSSVRAEGAVLDGVLVVLDELGRPSDEALEQRLRADGDAPLFFYAFDLVWFDGLDLRGLPLLERKTLCATILPPQATGVLHVDHVVGDGTSLAEVAAAAGLPGLIAKRAASPYAAGRHDDWRRIVLAAADDAGRTPVGEALENARVAPAARAAYTNLDKVYWPVEGYTKGDLVAYYEQVADVLVPYLRGRPVHLKRCPDGIDGETFYQRQAPEHRPDWLRTAVLPTSGDGEPTRHIVCDDRRSLLWLVNLGSIDLHPWSSRVETPDSPDWLILDLDPKEAPFAHVVRLARELGKVLRGIGLRPCVKTSGSTGIHVYVGLVPGYSYEEARMFAEGVARFVVRDHRDIATVERDMKKRGGRVYLDFGQNRRGQTVVPPYSVRPVPGARVSTPLDWDELDGRLDPNAFTIRTVPERLRERGDLFASILTDPQDLGSAIDALRGLLGPE